MKIDEDLEIEDFADIDDIQYDNENENQEV